MFSKINTFLMQILSTIMLEENLMNKSVNNNCLPVLFLIVCLDIF